MSTTQLLSESAVLIVILEPLQSVVSGVVICAKQPEQVITDTVRTAESMLHWPEAGQKVYVVVCVLFIAGDQIPVKPSREVEGREIALPEHIVPTGAKVGGTLALTLTTFVQLETHPLRTTVRVIVKLPELPVDT
jgi:hypothetical protein